jgi:hypothetical protein
VVAGRPQCWEGNVHAIDFSTTGAAEGGPIWDLTKALSLSPTLPPELREVAILVTGARFHAAYEIYAHVRPLQ